MAITRLDQNALLIPIGTTGERPLNPSSGDIRLNTEGNTLEYYDGIQWTLFAGFSPVDASGGDIVNEYTLDGRSYKYHQFNSSGTFTVNDPGTEGYIEYVVIAGGGGGGAEDAYGNNYGGSGGGGAGGYRSSVIGEDSGGGGSSETIINVASGQTFSISIGAGGSGGNGNGNGSDGSDTTFSSITSIGGGYGGGFENNGGNGGSGGGGGGTDNNNFGSGGSGTSGQGFDGIEGDWANFAGWGGAGGGSAGAPPGGGRGNNQIPGPGVVTEITGTPTELAKGGAGQDGIDRDSGPQQGASGATNTGEGGEGSTFRTGGAGGSGVVIIRYPTSQ